MALVNRKLSLPFGYYELFKLLNFLAEKGIAIRVEVIEVVYQKEIRVLPHNGGKDNYFWNLEVCFLECLTSVICWVLEQ